MRVRYTLFRGGAVVEADDLETLAVVQLQRLHDQMGGGVIVQIGRDIADAQARLRRQDRRRLVGNGRRVAIGLRHLLRGAEMIGGGGARHGEQRKRLDAIARPLVGTQRPEQALLDWLGRSPIGNAPRGMGRADAIGERVGQRRRPRIVIGSRLQAPLFRQQIGEIVVGADMVGVLRQHALIFRDGVLGLAEVGERIGEHHARARAGTVDRERFLQRRNGAREVARAAIVPTEMLPRQGILRRQGDGVEQRLLGILEGLARRLDVAEGAPGRGVRRPLLGQAACIGESLVDQATVNQSHDGPSRDVASARHRLRAQKQNGARGPRFVRHAHGRSSDILLPDHAIEHGDRKQRVGARCQHCDAAAAFFWHRRRPRRCPAPSSGSAK